ncbi:DUF3987 domain-containing protein [Actinomadura atramentaria]|uniref:DUF3987 domain-containing protein n=1 Tax=Actinomadura atramentaria TaxID=1990 RepID=UPI000360754B|nr:DUF3987 domain-containing protein [Actinomadura atramentaria]
MSRPAPLRVIDGNDDPELGRSLPHNIQAEQYVLGAVMLSPAVLGEVRALLAADDFYRPAHALIWHAVTELADRSEPTDALAVGNRIGARQLAKVGGAPYLHTLIADVPAAVNGGYYALMVRDLAYRRRVATAATRLTQLAHQVDGDSDVRTGVLAELAALTAQDARGWAEPTPLSAVPDLPEFPSWTLPEWMGEYAADIAEVTQTPVDLAGCLALTVLAVAAGGNVWVSAGPWSEPTNLYLLMVLAPGNRKSEVYKAMTAPIRDAESRLIEQAQPEIAAAVVARKVAEANAERAEKTATDRPLDSTARGLATDARLALEDATIPAEPKLFGGNDSTVEKATSRLAEQNGRYAVLAPEGGKLLSIAGGRYSGSPDIGVFLSGHAGEEIRIERIGRASERIDAATLTIGICLQPGVLSGLGDTPEFREQGLLGRLLVSMPESLLGRRNPNPAPVRPSVADDYRRTLKALVLSLREHGEPGHRPVTLTFTPEAQRAVTSLLAEIEPRLAPGTGDLAHMTDWAGKYVGAVVRIAALLHLGIHLRDGYQQPIGLQTFDHARQLGEYFIAHAQAAYDAIGADPAVNHARAVIDWARRTGTTRFTARDLMRGPLKSKFRKVADTEPALRVLESHGWVRRHPAPPNPGNRPPSPTYEVHPSALGSAS